MTSQSLTLIALTGLFSAPHCIAMCGGIVSGFTMRANTKALIIIVYYNGGRILTYTVLGAIMGVIGSFMDMAGSWVGFQGIASICGGLLMLLWIFTKIGLPLHHHRLYQASPVKRLLERLKKQGEGIAVFVSGLLFGLIPCGLTYAMQINAAASGNGAAGALSMAVFGLATMPALIIVALFAAIIKQSFRLAMIKVGNGLAVTIGLLCIMRGLSANQWIPAIHPWLW
ncbi:sulfite exporter TauE/SafE family protein [Paenibacillus eucommiae]|uniref:Sulfite exporter TauE/SafE n=1 Tax=Paenibacillus eucommiae TaxID=1355755 RepID=A0ABS4IQ94_9BACL|nr:sulfite exporter TauE/SafE family protein [Paenibacillus eucommiae]MBP1989738.1 sulfite exporter TauE/SafE [Paenibacillus eucommiae]